MSETTLPRTTDNNVPTGNLAHHDADLAKQDLPGPGLAFLGFFHEQSTRADDVEDELGQIGLGHPYLCIDDEYYDVGKASFIVLSAQTFFCTKKQGSYEKTNVWLRLREVAEAMGRDPDTFSDRDLWTARVDGDRVESGVAALVLFIPGAQALDEDLAPAFPIAVEVTGTKANGLLRHLKKLERTESEKWQKKNPTLTSVPKSYRIASQFKPIPKTSQSSGRAYAIIDATCSPTTVEQIAAINAFDKNKAMAGRQLSAEKRYTDTVNELKDKAAE